MSEDSISRIRDAEYELEAVDTLPDREPRVTAIRSKLASIKDDANLHGKFFRIAHYGSSSTASAAANNIRSFEGNSPKVAGWTVQNRKFEVEKQGVTVTRHGLFVKYEPEKITPEGRDEWMADRKAKADKRNATIEAKKVKAAQVKAEAAALKETERQHQSGAGHDTRPTAQPKQRAS